MGAERDVLTACVQRLSRVRRPSASAAPPSPRPSPPQPQRGASQLAISPAEIGEIAEIESLAAGTLAALAAAGARAAVVAAGGVEALVGPLTSPRPEVAMLAARALSALAEDAVNHAPPTLAFTLTLTLTSP